jgi:hypothetical protein
VKQTPQNNESEPSKASWPSVLQIDGDEFQQSVAVAQLAVKLCELKMAKVTAPLEKEKLDPKDFLAEAWKLVESAHEHVLRPQTDLEYLVDAQDDKQRLAEIFERKRRESLIPFQKLCDPKRNQGDSETIHGVDWKVYRSEPGFNNLFWDYWREVGEKCKSRDREIGTVEELDTSGKARKVDYYSPAERQELAKLARDEDAWRKRGESMLASWKSNGVPTVDLFALAKFRRKRDNRAANLKKKPKRKRRRRMAKARA